MSVSEQDFISIKAIDGQQFVQNRSTPQELELPEIVSLKTSLIAFPQWERRLKPSARHRTPGEKLHQRGISLIELIMFIVIVSVALAGILLVMNTVTKGSVDPLIHKQSLAIAESLLEEVELMPFTLCDPNDVNAASAVVVTDCTAGLDQNKGGGLLTAPTPVSEGRWTLADPFDNVADYGGFKMLSPPGICDITNVTATCTTPVAGLSGYQATVNVIRTGTTLGLASNDQALNIVVTVTGTDGVAVVLDGVRTRYSPRT